MYYLKQPYLIKHDYKCVIGGVILGREKSKQRKSKLNEHDFLSRIKPPTRRRFPHELLI
jgi:hypothetical protein